MSEQQHFREDLEACRERLAKIGPGWVGPLESPAGLLRAERPGSEKHEQASLTPEGLLDAVASREAAISTGMHSRPVIVTGLASTQTFRPDSRASDTKRKIKAGEPNTLVQKDGQGRKIYRHSLHVSEGVTHLGSDKSDLNPRAQNRP